MTDPLIGALAGSYRIGRVLGRGGMGTVYAGVHAAAGGAVAIKVLAEEHALERELLERFFGEARAVNLIRHENIVNILDLARLADGRPYIVMELLAGHTLRELLAEPPPLGGLLSAAVDLLEAIGAAHAIGIVHRDLKPDNVFVTDGGRTKVLDFGIAKLSGSGALRTRTGAVLGTPEYMAPEQISGGLSDRRTDLYAMGVMLFEGATGRRPFEGTDYELMIAHCETPPVAPSSLRAELPAALDDIILCALAKDPDDRFASAGDMIAALRYVMSALPIAQWRPLTARGRLRTPHPPEPPAAGRFVYAPRPPRSPPAATVSLRAVAEPATRVDRPPPPPPPSPPSRRWIPAAALAAAALAAVLAMVATRGHTAKLDAPAPAPRVALVASAAAAPPAPPNARDAALAAPPPLDAHIAADAAAPRQPRLPTAARDTAPNAAAVADPAPIASDLDADPYRILVTRERYDPSHFDVRAFYPRALALARQVLPDAVPVEITLLHLGADGVVQLTSSTYGPTYFRFYAANPATKHCEVRVAVLPDRVITHLLQSRVNCGEPRPLPQPRCTTEIVAARAHANGDDPRGELVIDAAGWNLGLFERPRIADDCR